jgi:hypothetical protein
VRPTSLIACAALAAGELATPAGCGSRASAPPHAPVTRAGNGIAVAVPPYWHLIRPPFTSLAYPDDRMLLTSYPTRAGGTCGPDRAEADLPAGGALIDLFEYRPRVGDAWSHLARSAFAPRPRRWALGPARATECWRVSNHVITFRAANRPFQVQVAFGARVGAARRAQVQGILRSLRFAAPAASTETGDTIRTRPGWRVRSGFRNGRSRHVSAAALEHALRTNPTNEATFAACRRMTGPQHTHVFGNTHAPLFACRIGLRGGLPARFDVQVLPGGCFVAERRRPGEADYGCVHG